MEEKKEKVQVRLSTAICIIIIIILLLAGAYAFYQNYLIRNELEANKSSLQSSQTTVNQLENTTSVASSDFKMLSIDTAIPKEGYKDTKYSLNKDFYSLFNISIRDGEAYFLSNDELNEFVISGIVTNENELKIQKGKEEKITGFNKKVVDVDFGGGQQATGCVIAFLMEDGTVEYSTIKNMVTKVTTQGKVEGLKNILKVNYVNAWDGYSGSTTVIALDNENNLYDIVYMLKKSGKI